MPYEEVRVKSISKAGNISSRKNLPEREKAEFIAIHLKEAERVSREGTWAKH